MPAADPIPFYNLAALHESIADELKSAIDGVLGRGQFILAEECSKFEAEFADYCGVRHCIGVGNGLDALIIMLRACKVGPGDKVIVPSNTFIATWLAVTAVGAELVPVEFSANPDRAELASLAEAIEDGVKAIVVVHLYGIPVQLQPIRELLAGTDIRLLEDAAQAHGARLHGQRAGALGDAAAFSFYPGKNLGALGDGGAITTDDDELAAYVRQFRNYGSEQKYEHEMLGVNSRLDEIQAAVLRVKLGHLDEWNAERRRVAAAYLAGLQSLPLKLPVVPEGAEPVWHLFPVCLEGRDSFLAFMQDAGVGLGIHYPKACHEQGAYASEFAADAFPKATDHARTTVSLPMGPMLGQADQDRTIALIKDWFKGK